jgi:uncharacterized surface protein with fasciclin (FAS1) repeats
VLSTRDKLAIDQKRKGDLMPKTKTEVEAGIMDLVSTESRFTKFNEAIKAAGLIERFSSPNKFTVFAPTNEAFAKIPQEKSGDLMKPENREQLKKLLLLHVVPGALIADDLKRADALKTEAGQPVTVSVSDDRKEIKVADANVMLPKEEARNGFLYPLDTVLQPITTAAASA